MNFHKCPKCKKRYVAKAGELCVGCAFVPKPGKVPPGFVPLKNRPASTQDSLEDDYGDESNADSVCRERSTDERTLP